MPFKSFQREYERCRTIPQDTPESRRFLKWRRASLKISSFEKSKFLAVLLFCQRAGHQQYSTIRLKQREAPMVLAPSPDSRFLFIAIPLCLFCCGSAPAGDSFQPLSHPGFSEKQRGSLQQVLSMKRCMEKAGGFSSGSVRSNLICTV